MGGTLGGYSRSEVKEYDPLKDTWVSKFGLTEYRHAGAAVSSGTKVFFGHGAYNNSYLVDMERYASIDNWVSDILVRQPLVGPAVGKNGGKISTLGGRSGSGLGTTNDFDVTD